MSMTPRTTNAHAARIRPIGLDAGKRLTGSLALLAILAMVLASPIHLLLAHGHSHAVHEEATVAQLDVAATGCQHHHHHCDLHGPAPAIPADDADSEPCKDHSGDCETCMALATITPLHVGFDTVVSQQDFLEFTSVIEDSPHVAWRGMAITSRGPPARA
ncbi:MAG: hypothetical protein MK085_05085 [Phycisphaerales bacterium]|nr:hypothetical protein [Phycisphaerales bacterium]